METLTAIPFIVCIIGIIVWAVSAKRAVPDAFWAEVGRIMFAFGLLISLATVAGKSLL